MRKIAWMRAYYEPESGHYFLQMSDVIYRGLMKIDERICKEGAISVNDVADAFEFGYIGDTHMYEVKRIDGVRIGYPKYSSEGTGYYPLIYSFIDE